MPREKDKGKTFSQLAKDIHKRYKDRTDPISQRGMKAEMASLREAQEKAKAAQVDSSPTSQLAFGGKMNYAEGGPLGGSDPGKMKEWLVTEYSKLLESNLNHPSGRWQSSSSKSDSQKRVNQNIEQLQSMSPNKIVEMMKLMDDNAKFNGLTTIPILNNFKKAFPDMQTTTGVNELDLGDRELPTYNVHYEDPVGGNAELSESSFKYLMEDIMEESDIANISDPDERSARQIARQERRANDKDHNRVQKEYRQGLRDDKVAARRERSDDRREGRAERAGERFEKKLARKDAREAKREAKEPIVSSQDRTVESFGDNDNQLMRQIKKSNRLKEKDFDKNGVGVIEGLDDNISLVPRKPLVDPITRQPGKPESMLSDPGKPEADRSKILGTPENIEAAEEASSDKGGNNLLRYAPILTNALSLFNKKPEVERPNLITAAPNQTHFDKVDLSGLKRDVAEQARGFTRSNMSSSGGNTGSFVSNELASQLNQIKGLTGANMQAAQANTEIERLNAAEQGRVDSFNMNKQQFNSRQQTFTDDINARNMANFDNIRSNAISQIGTDLGNVGREAQMVDVIGNTTGYSALTGKKLQDGGMIANSSLLDFMKSNLMKKKRK